MRKSFPNLVSSVGIRCHDLFDFVFLADDSQHESFAAAFFFQPVAWGLLRHGLEWMAQVGAR